MATASLIFLSHEQTGIARVDEITPEAIEAANKLLQKNHDENHRFWRSHWVETLFAQLFEGLYHPIIHFAFGIEF
ncbi:hypothetical protein BJX96DRAFT_178238 [Aspergillus floccosus]